MVTIHLGPSLAQGHSSFTGCGPAHRLRLGPFGQPTPAVVPGAWAAHAHRARARPKQRGGELIAG
jgi:hypothetical protein